MKHTLLFSAALATTVGLFALGALAQSGGAPAPASEQASEQIGPRMSIAQIATLLEDQGYTVLEIERERNRFDVEMIDADGKRVHAYMHPVTGAVLRDRDDDDYSRDDSDDDSDDRDDRDDDPDDDRDDDRYDDGDDR